MKLAIIVQARMGSTRLPGKVLMEAAGRPLLSHLIERLRSITCATAVIVATTTSEADDLVAKLARGEGALVVRGPEEDVLARYVLAARSVAAKNIMRITADCPLIDPEVCERVFELHAASSLDYAATAQDFAEGLDCEIITRQALETSHERAFLACEREHVTLHVRNHPGSFRMDWLQNDRDDSRYRVSVDEPEDIAVVRAVFDHLGRQDRASYSFTAVRSFLDAHPEIMHLNKNIVRNEGLLKSISAEAGQVNHQ